MVADASIYGMIAPRQQVEGPMDQYAKGLQIRHMLDSADLSQLQRQQLIRQMDEEKATGDAYAQSGGDPTKLRDILYGKGLYKPAIAAEKSNLETQKAKNDANKTRLEAEALKGKQLRDIAASVNSDADLPAAREAALRVVGPEEITKLPFFNQPFNAENKLRVISTADQVLEQLRPKLNMTNVGGQTVPTNPYTGAPAGTPIQHTATPGDILADRRGNQPVWDTERGVYVPRPPMGGSVMATQGGQPALASPLATGGQATAPSGIYRPPGLPPKSGDINAIREKFNDLPEVKNYRAAVPIYESALTAPDTKSGDIQFAYTIGKIFDPNSVVREGELKLVGEAGNVMQKYMGELRSLTEGKGRLTPQTRSELLAAAESRLNELKAVHDAARAPYERQADAQGLPKDQIFVDIKPKPRGQPKPAANRPPLSEIFR